MKSRKVRYAIITTFLVLVFGAYIGMDLYTYSTTSAINDPVVEQGGAEQDPSIGVGGDDEFNDDSTSEKVNLPSDPIDLINYGLNIYNNGKGSTSTLKYTLEAYGTLDMQLLHLNCGFSQHMDGNLIKTSTESLEEEWFYFDSIFPADIKSLATEMLLKFKAAKIGYRAINADQANDKVTLVETKKADEKTKTYDLNDSTATKGEWNYQEGTGRFIALLADDFPLEISYDTVQIRKNDVRKDKDYAYITVSYVLDRLPSDYDYYHIVNIYDDLSRKTRVTFTGYDFEFKINKKTGKIKQITKTENFNTYYAPKSKDGPIVFNINVRSSYVQTFQTMDKTPVINKIYEKYTKA